MNKDLTSWVIVRNPDFSVDSIRVLNWNSSLMGDYRGCIVADFNSSHGGRPHSFEEVEKNARLIAEAPNLLANLKRLVEKCDNTVLPDGSSIDTLAAHMAIAKVEGGVDES